MDHEEKVSLYVERLMDAYVRLRRKYRPTFVKVNSPNVRLWRSCATALIEMNLNPYQFAQYVFDLVTERRPDVYESEITSVKLANAHAQDRPMLKEKLKLQVSLQAAKIKNHLKLGEPLADILMNETYGLLLPVRFATAWSEGLKDLAEHLRPEAEEAIIFEPYYLELLKDYLPEDIHNVVRVHTS
jgi:hypothetical protein